MAIKTVILNEIYLFTFLKMVWKKQKFSKDYLLPKDTICEESDKNACSIFVINPPPQNQNKMYAHIYIYMHMYTYTDTLWNQYHKPVPNLKTCLDLLLINFCYRKEQSIASELKQYY